MDQLSYKLEVFEGPMDLLLHLISKHKLRTYLLKPSVCLLSFSAISLQSRYSISSPVSSVFSAQSKSDIVATFLAVLELTKTKKISIEGSVNNPDVQMILKCSL